MEWLDAIGESRLRYRMGGRYQYKRTPFGLAPGLEQKFIVSVLLSLIENRSGQWGTEDLFDFCVTVLGPQAAYEILKQACPSKIDPSDREDLAAWASKNLSWSARGERLIRDLFLPALEELHRGIRQGRNGGSELERRLEHVERMFQLQPEEVDLLFLFYVIRTNNVAQQFLGGKPLDLTDYKTLRTHGHTVLGQTRKMFLNILDRSPLFRADLITFGANQCAIQDWIADYLLGVGDRDLKNAFFSIGTTTDLGLADFGLTRADLRVLRVLLKSKTGCNILFYGGPGTGKTSLAHALAKHLKKELYAVRVAEEVRDSDFRLQAIHATINAAGGSRSLILVDEADEVLNTERPIYVRSAVDVDKSWLTNLLDNHQRKIIWVTNASRGISPSVMRRFSFSLHFDRLTPKNRATVFKHELAKRDLMNLFDDDDVRDLSNRYAVDAGGIVNAVNIMQLQTRSPKERVRETVEAVLKNHQFATRGTRNNFRPREVHKYSIEGLNTSPDLNAIIAALRDFAKGRIGNEVRSVSVMLHGPPGTGKTEFVHYLAGRLEKELVIKRVSDIEDKYVGETEKNIAQAFHEAQADNSILFFDEADSFFYPRKDATASWEKKFTNELLAQLDDFQGIVIFSTNDIEGLDHAALRRFKFKVRFSTLEPRGIRHFYGLMLGPLAAQDKGMKLEDLIRLEAMKGLTPGDFAVVRDQFLFLREEERTHRAMIAALEAEVEHKREKRKVTGFGG